jgi:hypothetical protein
MFIAATSADPLEPLYLGEISHKGERHPGQHPGIVGRDIWDAAQAMLAANGHEHATRSQAGSSLLAGLCSTNGNAITHTVKRQALSLLRCANNRPNEFG